MKIIKTRSKDLLIIEPIVHYDDRGYFFESYKNNLINHIRFIQDNESKSSKNTIRGLHFQNPPYEQTKLVRCISGKILDIAVDLRKESETYGEHFKLVLSGLNKKQFLIPRGFAHGYLVLSREAVVSYKVDNYYSPSHDNGIKWDDENLNINWGVNKLDIIVSEKDNNLPPLTKIFNPF